MRKIMFTASTGKIGSKREDLFTFEELGIDEKPGSKEEQKAIRAAYKKWLKIYVKSSFEIIEFNKNRGNYCGSKGN